MHIGCHFHLYEDLLVENWVIRFHFQCVTWQKNKVCRYGLQVMDVNCSCYWLRISKIVLHILPDWSNSIFCSFEVLKSYELLCYTILETFLMHLQANFSVGFENILNSYLTPPQNSA